MNKRTQNVIFARIARAIWELACLGEAVTHSNIIIKLDSKGLKWEKYGSFSVIPVCLDQMVEKGYLYKSRWDGHIYYTMEDEFHERFKISINTVNEKLKCK